MNETPQGEPIRPVLLVVMDGYGCNPRDDGNAIAQARRPVLSHLWKTCPHTEIAASGLAVGLPPGQMGNSEVGHLNLGAGKVVYQVFTRISEAIQEGSFYQNPALTDVMRHVTERGSRLHIMGLIGTGGVHAHQSHLFACIDLARRADVDQLFIHAITDGRDAPPTEGIEDVRQIEEELKRAGAGQIATVSGRYYAMDRDKRWDRTEKAYAAMVWGQGPKAQSAEAAVQSSYGEGITDEFIVPTVIETADGGPVGLVADGDGVIFFNFRTDRPRQLVRAFVSPDFHEFDRGPALRDLYFVTMTEYEKDLPVHVAFRNEDVSMPLARVLADRGLKQLHVAETEKYAHVTFFFNGGREAPFQGEERILVPSPREVGTYDKKPEMSAPEITKRTVEAIRSGTFDFILMNYANADMVGHTGVMDAAVAAVEMVDQGVGQVTAAAAEAGGVSIITADHGNAEQMIDYDTGGPYTAHTASNPVPFIIVPGKHRALEDVDLRCGGQLSDVAPTVLQLMGIPRPDDMTGNNLIAGRGEQRRELY